jgi:hypothetical protein
LGLWDITYIKTNPGMVYVAFVIEGFARKTVAGGRRAACAQTFASMRSSRRRMKPWTSSSTAAVAFAIAVDPLDRTSRQGRRVRSVGSKGDPFDNPFAESVIGLYKPN